MTNFLKGIVVGLGAIAPGLSGSVLLVIFGLYQKTIKAISTIFKDFINNLKFLIPLACGILLGIVIFSKLVDYLLLTFEMQTRFAFLGLILGSIPLFFKEVKKEGFSNKYYIYIAVAFLVGAYVFWFNQSSFPQVVNPNFFQSIILGLVVATSYVVPGIDSAAILSALGMYELWVSSLANLNLQVLIPAVIGAGAGVLVVSFIINQLINRYYTATFSIIFGFFLTIIPSVMNETCVLGFNLPSMISIVIFVVSLIASLLFSNMDVLKED